MNTFKAFEKHELKNQAVILVGAEEATAGNCVSVGYNRYVQYDSDCKTVAQPMKTSDGVRKVINLSLNGVLN